MVAGTVWPKTVKKHLFLMAPKMHRMSTLPDSLRCIWMKVKVTVSDETSV